MTLRWKLLGAAAACAACCAPLVLPLGPLLAGAAGLSLGGIAGSLAGLPLEEIACGAGIAALALFAFVFLRRRAAAMLPAAPCGCAGPCAETEAPPGTCSVRA